MKREERIAKYEEIMDRAAAAVKVMEAVLTQYEMVQKDLDTLETYYTSPEWKADYEADEEGLLPEGLKRGVLSQDGISDLLDRNRELREHLSEIIPSSRP